MCTHGAHGVRGVSVHGGIHGERAGGLLDADPQRAAALRRGGTGA